MGDGSDAIMRGQDFGGHGREQLAKLSQVIQVRWIDGPTIGRHYLIVVVVLELLYQSCVDNSTCENRSATDVLQRLKD